MTIIYLCDEVPNTLDDTVIRNGINTFNQAILKNTAHHFSLFAKEDNIIIGGALIWQHDDSLYIDSLWCDEIYRHQGIGSTLMTLLFTIALDKSIAHIFVDTYDFQAKGFYQKHGFECIGTVPRYLLEYDRLFFKKTI